MYEHITALPVIRAFYRRPGLKFPLRSKYHKADYFLLDEICISHFDALTFGFADRRIEGMTVRHNADNNAINGEIYMIVEY